MTAGHPTYDQTDYGIVQNLICVPSDLDHFEQPINEQIVETIYLATDVRRYRGELPSRRLTKFCCC